MFVFFLLAAGLQAILPEYLRARFVQAALSYIGCNEEGQFVCRNNDCWCQCAEDYPQCNCPEVDLRAMEVSLLKIRDTWNMANQEFEESGQCFPFFFFFNECDPPTDGKLDPIVRAADGQRKRGTIASNPCNWNSSVHRRAIFKAASCKAIRKEQRRASHSHYLRKVHHIQVISEVPEFDVVIACKVSTAECLSFPYM